MKKTNKNTNSFLPIFLLATALFLLSFFIASAAGSKSISEKNLQGIWSPVKFLQIDYEEGGRLKDIPLKDVEGGVGERYLEFRGNTVCTDGILGGPNKKLCGESADAPFREYWIEGSVAFVWADNEKTYTTSLDITLEGNKLIETYGSGSQKIYQKAKDQKVKKQKVKKSKKSAKTSKSLSTKPTGTWKTISIYDGMSQTGPFTENTFMDLNSWGFTVTFSGNGFCTTHWEDAIDYTKPHCESPLVFNKDGTFFGQDGKLSAYGGFMKLPGQNLEWLEAEKGGYTKYVLEKQK